MKTILFYLVVIFFSILSTNVFAQDEFYNNKKGAETISVKEDSVDLSSYTTAEDYYEVGVVEENNTNEQVDTDNYRDEDTRSEKRRKSEKNEFISNLVVDVFINVVFIALTFWQ